MAANLNEEPRTSALIASGDEVRTEAERIGIGVFLSPAIREDLLVLAPTPLVHVEKAPALDRVVGFKVFESVGVAIANPRAAQVAGARRQIVLVDVPIPLAGGGRAESSRLRAVWRDEKTDISVFYPEAGSPGRGRSAPSHVGIIGDDGFRIVRNGRAVNGVLGPPELEDAVRGLVEPYFAPVDWKDPFWEGFLKEAERLHVAASVMEA